MMNKSSWAKLIFLATILIMPLYASAETISDAFNRGYYGTQQQAEELKRQQQENEMARQQIEQQKLETQRRTDEYNRQKKEQEEQEQKQKSTDARLD